MRPLFLTLVLVVAAAFGTATVFASRMYQAKQLQLGQMYFGRGQAALAGGQAGDAIQDFRNALYYSHDDPEYRLRLAEALVAANRIPEAQSYLITLWQDEPGNSTVNLQLGRLAARQGRTGAALRYYHGAIYGLWPGGEAGIRRQQTRLELIRYLLGLHDTTQADGELIALTPELPNQAGAHSEVGWLFLQTGDPERGLEEFRRALHLNARDSSACFGAGQAAFKLRQYRAAEGYLDRAVRLQPGWPQAQQLLGTTRLIRALNPYERGLSSRQRARRISDAFQRARRRLRQCSASSTVQGPSAGTQPAANASEGKGTAPVGSSSGLMARILGKVERAPATAAPASSPPRNLGAELQQLGQQAKQLRREVRPYKLERDPQLADSAMELVAQIERVSAQQCGTPQGADFALLLLAQRAEEQ